MPITAVRKRLMPVPRQNWHFVEVDTDAGLTGVSAASLEGRERAVAAAVDDL
jgi:L-alanine-DL-glutamate epimerase-like enolase superfamily enzyme